MTPSRKILSAAEMKVINDQALAAVRRGEQVLAHSSELREKAGITPEQIQKVYHALTPQDRAFIDTAVKLGVAEINAPVKSGSSRARKPRQMV